MPLRREAYAKVKPNGPYPGLEPMKNSDGHEACLRHGLETTLSNVPSIVGVHDI